MIGNVYLSALLIVIFYSYTSVEARPQLPAIPREFQNINFEQYLRNERAMKFQMKCLIYNGPCDTIGKYLKRHIPNLLRTTCKNCDEEQKKLGARFISFLQENYPQEWDDALAKYGKPNYSEDEIAEFERELGVRIVRDKNASTRAPGAKPDIEGLVSLAKEGINVALNTKKPLILGKLDSDTTEIVSGVTVPPNLAKYTTPTTSS